MTIITLNTWGGRAGRDRVLDFFKRHAHTTDVFCLQEIWADRYDELEGSPAGGRPVEHKTLMSHALADIAAVLTEHIAYFRPHYREHYGLCMFVRKNMQVVEEGEAFVHLFKGFVPEGDVGHHARNIQFVTLDTPSGPRTVINFHGLWNGNGKGDCAERLVQSDRILEFVRTLDHPFVLCGDFNLTPDTESLRRLEREGMENLIRTYGITSTRTNLYSKPEKYADYVLASAGIAVHDFAVLPDEVSDHAPLYLEMD